jgi:hypothetical protein
MEKEIQHETLGKIKVLMSFERKKEKDDSSRCVLSLVSSMRRKYISDSWKSMNIVSYREAYTTGKGIANPNYYLMWGVNDNLNESSFLYLTSRNGRKSTLDASIKFFMEAKNATEFVNFLKI